MARTVLLFTLAVGFLVIPFLTHAEVYKWTDDKGEIHFTDEYSTIPEKYLPSVEIESFPKVSAPPSAEEKPTPPPAPAPAPKRSEPLVDTRPRLFSGVISTVTAGMIVVAGEEEDMAFLISGDTKIAAGEGTNVPFAELRAGMPVTVEYMKDGNDIRALSIRVSTMPKGVPTRQKAPKK